MKKKEISHYYPNYRSKTSLFKELWNIPGVISKYKDLIWQLTYRDISSVYRRSLIGLLWLIVTPFIQIITWVLLKNTSILNPGELNIPYPFYLLTGTLIWGLFISVLNSSMSVFKQSRMIMMRVMLPFEVFFVVQVFVKLIPFLLSVLIIIPLLIFFNISLSINLFLLPFAIIPVVGLATALGMLMSVFTALSYDIKRIAALFFNFLMFFTPIVFSVDKIQEGLFRTLIFINPLTHILPFIRNLFFEDKIIFTSEYILSVFFTFGLLLFAWRFLYLTSNRILERTF